MRYRYAIIAGSYLRFFIPVVDLPSRKLAFATVKAALLDLTRDGKRSVILPDDSASNLHHFNDGEEGTENCFCVRVVRYSQSEISLELDSDVVGMWIAVRENRWQVYELNSRRTCFMPSGRLWTDGRAGLYRFVSESRWLRHPEANWRRFNSRPLDIPKVPDAGFELASYRWCDFSGWSDQLTKNVSRWLEKRIAEKQSS